MVTKNMPTLRDTIAEDLRTQITTGHLKSGDRLPSEPKLATHYKVSTPTVRQALALLQAEGLIEKTHGKGNFVRAPLRPITYKGGAGIPFAPDLQTTIRTTTVRARGHIRTLLRVPSNTPLTEFHCTTYEGETPRSVARIYIPRDLAPAAQPSSPPLARQSRCGPYGNPGDGHRPPPHPGRGNHPPHQPHADGPRHHAHRPQLHRPRDRSRAPGTPQQCRRRGLHHPPDTQRRGDRQMTSRYELRLLP